MVSVGSTFKSVCLFAHQFVCLRHNSKTKDPKVFKLGIGNDLGYPRNDMVLDRKVTLKGQVHGVNKCIFTLLSTA